MPPPTKKRKVAAPEEIKFDFAAREEYLTGFSKRKQARIKHAQEEAAKREKEERLRMRRELRQQRKVDLEAHVKEVNTLLRKANPDLSDAEEPTSNPEEEGDWEGFEEPAVEIINHEDEYIDEDKYTTVTIESVGISKEGFEKAGGEDDEGGNYGDKDNNSRKTEGAEGREDTRKKVWTKERPKSDRPKKRKQKFRYESKADRKAERIKISVKKKARAQARKGK
ncbi:nucleolar protein 12-domain-containing protein [Lophiotrema nucula]|uniref:Nucleolar protein 12-domain-containing protein n=1 Tax=Lophiotrema nucula TaxID=690887 RepID=A0A6A5YQQ3_9PLEO|nr:nucleolar protein 12-domain-containing protein [Lophiotrema nucula]